MDRKSIVQLSRIRLTHVQSADVYGVQLSIIAEGHRGNLWANAQAVYAAITGEAIARYEELEDECQIAEVIDDCTEGLAICLDTQRDLPEEERLSDASREELLSALFEIWKFGQDYGGVDTDVVDTIASNVTNDERKMVEGWLQQEIHANQGSNRRNQGLESFLVKLQEV